MNDSVKLQRAWASSKHNRAPLRCETYGSATWVLNNFNSQFHFSGGLLFRDTFCRVVTCNAAVPPARGCRWRAAKDYSSLRSSCLPLKTLLICVHHWLFISLILLGSNFDRGRDFLFLFFLGRSGGYSRFTKTWNNSLSSHLNKVCQFWDKPFTQWTNWDY